MRIAFKALAALAFVALLVPVGLAAQTPEVQPIEKPIEIEAIEPAPQLVLVDEAPSCSVSPLGDLAPGAEAQPQRDWDPATCAACGEHCSSDNLCFGRLIGDFCTNNGGICRAFDGCALFNCCRCSNG